MSVNLATQLREGTKKSHSMAENVGFVKCFLKGVVEKNSYRKLVGNLYFVYSAMEEEMDKLREHPIVSQIYYPELNRKQSLEQDLQFYYGPNWRQEVKISAAGKAYVDRIHEIAATQPELLVAHSYTRYLGDLSGGQILKKIAQNAFLQAKEFKESGNKTESIRLYQIACGADMRVCYELGVLEAFEGNWTEDRRLWQKVCDGGNPGGSGVWRKNVEVCTLISPSPGTGGIGCTAGSCLTKWLFHGEPSRRLG